MATAAGLAAVATASGYTPDEDFSEAALVVSSLGDAGSGCIEILADRAGMRLGTFVMLSELHARLGHD